MGPRRNGSSRLLSRSARAACPPRESESSTLADGDLHHTSTSRSHQIADFAASRRTSPRLGDPRSRARGDAASHRQELIESRRWDAATPMSSRPSPTMKKRRSFRLERPVDPRPGIEAVVDVAAPRFWPITARPIRSDFQRSRPAPAWPGSESSATIAKVMAPGRISRPSHATWQRLSRCIAVATLLPIQWRRPVKSLSV